MCVYVFMYLCVMRAVMIFSRIVIEVTSDCVPHIQFFAQGVSRLLFPINEN